ncbi:MAG: 6-phosphogluconolactonase [Planctomycetia bacterium]|nr:6-phosphogluconolactonase [Planctomycetia bacterium]
MSDPSSPLPVFVVRDPTELAATAADWFAELAHAAVAARGRFTVALAGGSTPEGLYRELARRTLAAGKSEGGAGVPWSDVHIYFGDERYVPHDDPQSNFRMARETLLEHVPIPPAHVFPMPTDAAQPADAATVYERILAADFKTSLPLREGPGEGKSVAPPNASTTAQQFPQFDLILLGMGPDGHTASLFPGTAAVHEQQRWVVAPWVEKFNTFRITLTPPVLCAARDVLFLVSGASKADVLHNVLEGPYQPDVFPCQVVRPAPGRLRWLIDQPAAAKLTRQTMTVDR